MLRQPPATATEALHLTEFKDRSSPRPGADALHFRMSSNQSSVQRLGRDEFDLAFTLQLLAWIGMVFGGGWIAWRGLRNVHDRAHL
ncbi:MAG: hypothetical protein O3A91_07665, partial [Proteobacteria bacterium]|nr:hypothetical protein [Pseudomonadota bacterium]